LSPHSLAAESQSVLSAFSAGGARSWRRASSTTWNGPSYFFSNLSFPRSVEGDSNLCRAAWATVPLFAGGSDPRIDGLEREPRGLVRAAEDDLVDLPAVDDHAIGLTVVGARRGGSGHVAGRQRLGQGVRSGGQVGEGEETVVIGLG